MADSATVETTENTERHLVESYVRDALRNAGMNVADLTDEQYLRALDAPTVKAGLRDQAVAKFVLEGSTAPAKAAAKEKKPRAKKAAAAKPVSRAKGYPEWVPSAVERAKKLSAQKGFEEGQHVPSAGPIQHAKVRKVVTEALGGDVTTERILELAGVPSKKALRDIATFKSDRASLKSLRPLGAKFDTDGWCKGRFLAAILTVWIDDEEKAAKLSE